MIRQAEEKDIPAIAQTYTALLTWEKEHGGQSNWVLDVYPTAAVPGEKVPRGEMFVLEEDGEVLASMVLNQEQLPEYAGIPWAYAADPEHVLVIHTLCVPPAKAGRGFGTRMIAFALSHARSMGCTVVRIDTYAHNQRAKALYLKNGFRLAGYADSLFMGVIPEELAFLERTVDEGRPGNQV